MAKRTRNIPDLNLEPEEAKVFVDNLSRIWYRTQLNHGGVRM